MLAIGHLSRETLINKNQLTLNLSSISKIIKTIVVFSLLMKMEKITIQYVLTCSQIVRILCKEIWPALYARVWQVPLIMTFTRF
jgi:hypothetical protein